VIFSRTSVGNIAEDAVFPRYLKDIDFVDLDTQFESKYLPELIGRVRGDVAPV
jgi:hypothetical protein